MLKSHTDKYPHVGGCEGCRSAKVCNYCGGPTLQSLGRCTNGRCRQCHAHKCAEGGDVDEGHGYGLTIEEVSK